MGNTFRGPADTGGASFFRVAPLPYSVYDQPIGGQVTQAKRHERAQRIESEAIRNLRRALAALEGHDYRVAGEHAKLATEQINLANAALNAR
jgi:hypothetical protein